VKERFYTNPILDLNQSVPNCTYVQFPATLLLDQCDNCLDDKKRMNFRILQPNV
jgi:hypothetical protein